jgi:selenocysteine-specific elongation factor
MTRGIIGTAGHIDHGKTALVEALTGVRTDRLPEEKRRGITIDLGFAHLELGDDLLGVVDVPGHEDFVRNMVAGATGIDLLLLVVAADEGVMPQTREHVAIASLLGVPRAVVALTKADLVEPDWLELATDDVATFLQDTPFAAAPICPTSALSGRGLEQLRSLIVENLPGTRGQPDDLFRLPVDRAFSVHGTGTVVTGAVWSGRLRRDQAVRVLPGNHTARVRGLQVHGVDVEEVQAGQRAAVAVVGLDRTLVTRGATLVTDPEWEETSRLTARIQVLATSEWTIEHGQRLRIHLGTAEAMGRAFLLDAEILAPGEAAWAQIGLETPVLARTGDRLVLRSYSPVTTIGGGLVVEPRAARRRRLRTPDATAQLDRLAGSDPEARVLALLDAAGGAGIRSSALPILAGASPERIDTALARAGAIAAGTRVHTPAAARAVAATLTAAVQDFHRAYPLKPGMDPAELRRIAQAGAGEALVSHMLHSLLGDGTLVMRDGLVRRPDFSPTLTPLQLELRESLLLAFQGAGSAPPRTDELRRTLGNPAHLDDLLALLETDGHLVRLEHDLFIHRQPLDALTNEIQHRYGGRSGITPAEFRDVVQVSRKHLLPILAYLDRTGITTRAGEGRAVAALHR